MNETFISIDYNLKWNKYEKINNKFEFIGLRDTY